ncbi:MAG: GAF domain-containing protein [Deltaproteobacteria bacterium]|nr:GAF domain-containing protein [Deltaproteobacteria bacterium]
MPEKSNNQEKPVEPVRAFLASLTEQARELLQADTASIWLAEGDKIVLRAAAGYSEDALRSPEAYSYELGDGVTGHIAQGHAFRGSWDALRKHPSWRGKWDDVQWMDEPDRLRVLSFVGVPILFEGKAIGVLKVENKSGERQFTEADQRLLENLATLIATALKTRPDLARRAPGPYIFVLMPFAEEFRDIYELGIKATAENLGMRCERVDEIEFNDAILAQIYSGIQRADLVIADMTGRNPNVFYEVGYAHALSKDVVLLTQKAEDIPFDLKGHNHIIYGNSITTLQRRLEKRLKGLTGK